MILQILYGYVWLVYLGSAAICRINIFAWSHRDDTVFLEVSQCQEFSSVDLGCRGPRDLQGLRKDSGFMARFFWEPTSVLPSPLGIVMAYTHEFPSIHCSLTRFPFLQCLLAGLCAGNARFCCSCSRPSDGMAEAERHPYPLKDGIWGGGVVLKFHFKFKIPFLQSCFLNDQYSSSFHVIGKQMKIKYLRLAPEGPSTYQTEAAHV